MNVFTLKKNIKENLKNGLPGVSAHSKMWPFSKDLDKIPSHGFREAAVVALLYPVDDEMHILFIIRSNDPRDKHAGQIGFPGGKFEEADQNMQTTAERELFEEIGVNSSDYEIVSPLTRRYVTASDFLIYPFLAISNSKPILKLQEEEVSDVIEVPLSYFTGDIKKRKDIKTHKGIIENVPYYDIYGKTLWGATAMIMSEIEELIF